MKNRFVLLFFILNSFLLNRIRVKIDGIDIPSSDTNELCTVNVYPSTTIHELRTLVSKQIEFIL
jgi:hypothetical protein